jgi:hypothetical protein
LDTRRRRGDAGGIHFDVRNRLCAGPALANAYSGVKAHDQAAIIAAGQSRYAPQIYRCNPISGDYFFIVEFEKN